jgi:hypothetical protein
MKLNRANLEEVNHSGRVTGDTKEALDDPRRTPKEMTMVARNGGHSRHHDISKSSITYLLTCLIKEVKWNKKKIQTVKISSTCIPQWRKREHSISQ